MSQLVAVIFLIWHFLFLALAFPNGQRHGLRLAPFGQGVFVEHLPVVEHALREGLSARVRTQVLIEPEGLRYRQLAFQDDTVVFLNGVEDAATALVQGGLHSAHDVGCARDLHEEDRLLLTGLCAELAGEARVSGRRRNL